MEYFALIWTVTTIHILGCISPGPDFVMAVKNSLTYSRKTGIYTALGFVLGMAVHLAYCVAGVAFIIAKSIIIFNIIKLLGAGYLMYIGIKSIMSKSSQIDIVQQDKKKDISPLAAVRMGFLTNILNPKATIFFLSLFTLVISPTTPAFILVIMSLIMITFAFLWFSLVAIFFTQKAVQSAYSRFQKVLNKVFGGLLIVMGVKVALAER